MDRIAVSTEHVYMTDTDGHTAHCKLIGMITVFHHLADVVLIEILSYLRCADVLSAFTCLNGRITGLLSERGFFAMLTYRRCHVVNSIGEYESVLMFGLIHAATLTHIIIESNEYFLTVSVITRVVRS
jgi:hypothetical protein